MSSLATVAPQRIPGQLDDNLVGSRSATVFTQQLDRPASTTTPASVSGPTPSAIETQTVAVVGLGYIGLPTALALARPVATVRPIGADRRPGPPPHRPTGPAGPTALVVAAPRQVSRVAHRHPNDVRTARRRSREIAYGRHATADWASYQASVTVTATATVSGLAAEGTESASVVARVRSDQPVYARVSSTWLQLSVGKGAETVVIGQVPLAAAGRHTVTMTVSPTSTDVLVDGAARLSAPADGGPSSYGGLGFAGRRVTETTVCPTFAGLAVTAGDDAAGIRSGVGVPAFD